MKNSLKNANPTVTKSYGWKWNPARVKAANLAATTSKTQEEIAHDCNVSRKTVNEWFQVPEFLDKVTELILLDERATKAGILRRALRTLESKSANSENDKTTELDYMKFIVELMFGKQNNGVTVAVQNNTNVQMDVDSIKEKMKKYEVLFSDE